MRFRIPRVTSARGPVGRDVAKLSDEDRDRSVGVEPESEARLSGDLERRRERSRRVDETPALVGSLVQGKPKRHAARGEDAAGQTRLRHGRHRGPVAVRRGRVARIVRRGDQFTAEVRGERHCAERRQAATTPRSASSHS